MINPYSVTDIDLNHLHVSPAVAKKLAALDKNHDGHLTGSELGSSGQFDPISSIRSVAQTQGDWDMVRTLATMKKSYAAIDGSDPKGMGPGEGGRFKIMVDQLQAKGYSPEQAKALAVTIGRAHGKIG